MLNVKDVFDNVFHLKLLYNLKKKNISEKVTR